MELGRREALGIGQGLLARIPHGHQIVEGFGDLNVIAKHPVVLNLEVLDSCLFPLFCLKVGNPLPSVGGGLPQLVQFRRITGANHMPLTDQGGGIRIDGRGDLVCDLVKRVQFPLPFPDQARIPQACQAGLNSRHMRQRPQQGQTVPRADSPVGNPAQEAFDVIDIGQLRTDSVCINFILHKGFNGIQPGLNVRPDSKRLLNEPAQRS